MVRKEYHSKREMNAQAKINQRISLTKHLHFLQIHSTNTWAKQHPDQWAHEGVTLITASEQTAGRGRFKRQWISPPHLNIYATFCFWLNPHRTDIGHIPQLLALAAVQTLDTENFSPSIKWPNDVLIKNKKIAGILCETIFEQEKRGMICGIGLNVNMPEELLDQIDRPATSMQVEKGCSFEVPVILDLLQNFFLAALNQFIDQGFSPFFLQFEKRSALKKGQKIQFHDNQTLIEAQFEKLCPDGSVQLKLSNGNFKNFYAGEFIF